MNFLGAPFLVLRDTQGFLDEVRRGEGLRGKAVSLFVSSFVLFAVFGAIMGSFDGPLQALSSAIKLPVLFLLTVLICLPTLYVACLFLGAREKVEQYAVALLGTLAVTAVLLVSFAPVSVFFMLTGSHYQFFKLLNVTFLSISGLVGIRFFGRVVQAIWGETGAMRKNVLLPWMFLYAFVGTQLGWALRPFFGAPGEKFEVVRQLDGNFYVNVGRSMGEALGLSE
jgi:hypothetical protein